MSAMGEANKPPALALSRARTTSEMSKGGLKTRPPGQTKSFHHGKMEVQARLECWKTRIWGLVWAMHVLIQR